MQIIWTLLIVTYLFFADITGSATALMQATTTPSTRPSAGHSAETESDLTMHVVPLSEIGETAKDAHPLTVGSPSPATQILTQTGEAFDLTKAFKSKPTILIFYRGGWCPYCTAHLVAVGQIEPELLQMGYQILGVSPDSPTRVAATLAKTPMPYTLLSDSEMSLARAFGLAFYVDQKTAEKYAGYGIELTISPESDRKLLPVPAVFIIDTDGLIRFVHAEPDYSKRLAPDALLLAAKNVLKK